MIVLFKPIRRQLHRIAVGSRGRSRADAQLGNIQNAQAGLYILEKCQEIGVGRAEAEGNADFSVRQSRIGVLGAGSFRNSGSIRRIGARYDVIQRKAVARGYAAYVYDQADIVNIVGKKRRNAALVALRNAVIGVQNRSSLGNQFYGIIDR